MYTIMFIEPSHMQQSDKTMTTSIAEYKMIAVRLSDLMTKDHSKFIAKPANIMSSRTNHCSTASGGYILTKQHLISVNIFLQNVRK